MTDVRVWTLTEFLLARIAEDEALDTDNLQLLVAVRRRARAECQAKRRMVARHAQDGGAESWMDADWVADMSDGERAGHCSWCTYDDRTVGYPCPDLRDLAEPYADHPDYDEGWRP